MDRRASLIVLDRDGVLNRTVPNPAEPRPDSPLHVARGVGLPVGAGRAARAERRRLRPGDRQQPAGRREGQDHARRARRRCTPACWPRRSAAGGVILSSHICFHRAEDACACRKPRTGLLREAFARHPSLRPRRVVDGRRSRHRRAGGRGVRAADRAAALGDRPAPSARGRAAARCAARQFSLPFADLICETSPALSAKKRIFLATSLDPTSSRQVRPMSTHPSPCMQTPTSLARIKIFADGASLPALLELAAEPADRRLHDQPDADAQGRRQGLPRLRARGAGAHPRRSRSRSRSSPTTSPEMNRQAREIAAWGDNVYVKIPITNTQARVGASRWCAS